MDALLNRAVMNVHLAARVLEISMAMEYVSVILALPDLTVMKVGRASIVVFIMLMNVVFFKHLNKLLVKPFCSETMVKTFEDPNSYIEWRIENDFNSTEGSPFISELQLMFRTRQDSGVLYTITSFSSLEHLRVKVIVY